MDDLVVSPKVTIPAVELSWRFDSSGGPGGQHANKSSTRAELRLDVAASSALDPAMRRRVLEHLEGELSDGVLTIQVAESRSQWRNRQIARKRLGETLRTAMQPPPPKRRATKPSRGAKERRLAEKRSRSQTKQLRRRPIEPD